MWLLRSGDRKLASKSRIVVGWLACSSRPCSIRSPYTLVQGLLLANTAYQHIASLGNRFITSHRFKRADEGIWE